MSTHSYQNAKGAHLALYSLTVELKRQTVLTGHPHKEKFRGHAPSGGGNFS